MTHAPSARLGLGLAARLRLSYRAAGFAAITLAMTGGYKAEARLARTFPPDVRRRVRDDWTRRWSHALLDLYAVEIERYTPVAARGTGKTACGRLVVANHRSTIDVAVLLSTFGGRLVSRADLASWPVLGPAARSVGTLFVERGRSTSGAELIRQIRNELRDGETIGIFPEGTTFADDAIHPFQAGAFAAAYRSGAEIVPVGLAYCSGSGAAFVDESFLEHLRRMSAAPPTRVGMVIGEPIATEGCATSRLVELATDAVAACTREARRRVDRLAR